jgi:hypothetical protein
MFAMKKEAETIKQNAEMIKEQIITANAFRSSIEKLTTVLQQQDKSECLLLNFRDIFNCRMFD